MDLMKNDWQLANELQAIILISLSLVLFKLFTTGQINSMLESRLIPYAFFAMAAMFLLGFFRMMNSDMYGADCDCEACDQGGTGFFGLLQYGVLFFLPIFIALNYY